MGPLRGLTRDRALSAAVLAAVLCLAAPAPGQTAGPAAPGAASAASYNEATGALEATGSAPIQRDDPTAMPRAFALAENEARLQALDALLQYVHGIETPTGTVGSRVEGDQALRTLVESYVQGATLLEKRFLPDGRLEVVLELGLAGLGVVLER